MTKPHRPSSRRPPIPEPPLLDYINRSASESRFAERRNDAEQATARLYREQMELIAADKAAPAEWTKANDAVMDAAAEVNRIGTELKDAMEAGQVASELRHAYAEAQGILVEAHSHLDNLNRHAAERVRRLTQIVADIESWGKRWSEAVDARARKRVVP